MTDLDNSSTNTEERIVLEKAMALHMKGHVEPAIALYKELLEKNPDNPDALHYLGLACCPDGRFDEAIELISRAISIAPDYVEAINNLGVICQGLGKFSEAEECYRQVIELKPGHADSHNNLGIILKNQRRMTDAAKAFEEALAINPGHARAHHNLGNLHRRAGHHDKAASHFRAAIDNGLETMEGRQALVSALMENGSHNEAVSVLEQWLDEEPDNPVALHLRAALNSEQVPSRASDGFVKSLFDRMAANFDHDLQILGYRAPELVMASLQAGLKDDRDTFQVLDAGCGTGLCGPLLKPLSAFLAGVDLSPKMLRRAQMTGAYDELHEAELTEFLQNRPDAYDVIVCADTLCYFGDLADVTKAAATSLRKGGHFVFTVEQLTGEEQKGFLIHHSGRYSHSRQYIGDVLERAGLSLVSLDVDVLRRESGQEVTGFIVNASIADPV